jgi:hypothetical protein
MNYDNDSLCEAMDLLIDIILSEYPETDHRYKIAMDIAIKFGIIEEEPSEQTK